MRAAHLPFSDVALALATYRHHAYMLSTRLDPTRSDAPAGVYFTTDESGAWTTRLLSARAPLQLIEENQTALALDPGTRRLYAAWAYNARPGYDTIGVWTRDAAGTWRGPSAISTLSSAGPASIVAAQGKVYVAFTAQEDASSAPCHNSRTDVFVTAYDGSTWSAPQNVTNCVSGLANGDNFYAPRLALDGGHLYLTSANSSQSTWDLWYMDNAGGTWSRPVQITHRRENDMYHYDYSIAASEGTAYVAYTAYTGVQGGGTFGHHDVFLATHAPGGAWTVRDVTKEPYNCDKYAPALVARAGRLALAYVFAEVNAGACGSSSAASAPFMGVHLLTGTPGHWVEAPLTRGERQRQGQPRALQRRRPLPRGVQQSRRQRGQRHHRPVVQARVPRRGRSHPPSLRTRHRHGAFDQDPLERAGPDARLRRGQLRGAGARRRRPLAGPHAPGHALDLPGLRASAERTSLHLPRARAGQGQQLGRLGLRGHARTVKGDAAGRM